MHSSGFSDPFKIPATLADLSNRISFLISREIPTSSGNPLNPFLHASSLRLSTFILILPNNRSAAPDEIHPVKELTDSSLSSLIMYSLGDIELFLGIVY